VKLLPVALDLENRAVLIVGGGAVAARKAAAFLEAGALVTVVSPDLSADFPAVNYRAKRYESADWSGFSLICACTDNAEINAQIALDAKSQNIWCNIADAPENSDFHTVAVVRRGEIAVGISTDGISPVLSRHLKREIENCVGPEYAQLLEIAARFPLETHQRGAFWRAVLESDALQLLRSNEHLLAAERLETVFKSLAPN